LKKIQFKDLEDSIIDMVTNSQAKLARV